MKLIFIIFTYTTMVLANVIALYKHKQTHTLHKPNIFTTLMYTCCTFMSSINARKTLHLSNN